MIMLIDPGPFVLILDPTRQYRVAFHKSDKQVYLLVWVSKRHKNHHGIAALPSRKFLRVTLEIALGSFRTVWKTSRQSGNCRMVRKVSGQPGKFPDRLDIFRMIEKFLDSLDRFAKLWPIVADLGHFLVDGLWYAAFKEDFCTTMNSNQCMTHQNETQK